MHPPARSRAHADHPDGYRRPDLPLAVRHGRPDPAQCCDSLHRAAGSERSSAGRERGRDRWRRGALELRTLRPGRGRRPAASDPVGDAQLPPLWCAPSRREHAVPLVLRDRGRREARGVEVPDDLPGDRHDARGAGAGAAHEIRPGRARGRGLGGHLRAACGLHDLGAPERAELYRDPHRRVPRPGVSVGPLLHDGGHPLHRRAALRAGVLGVDRGQDHGLGDRPPLGGFLGHRSGDRPAQDRAGRLRELGRVLDLVPVAEARPRLEAARSSGSTTRRGPCAGA